MPFAVIDFETTGIFWNRDRVIEVGVVLLDDSLEVEAEFETLINPNRDLGPQHIHQIKSSWILNAPSFEDVAADVAECLRGRTVVAHNASFDAHFAEREFQRLAQDFSFDWLVESNLPSGFVCTKRLSRHLFGVQAQSLGWLANAMKLSNERPHAAISDARLTSEIFRKLVIQSKSAEDEVFLAGSHGNPSLEKAKATRLVTRPVGHSTEKSVVDQILDGLEPLGSDDGLAAFSNLLLQNCLDFELSTHQAMHLAQLAKELGLGVQEVQTARELVFQTLARHFWSDGRLSDFEEAGLEKLAENLEIDSKLLEANLEAPAADHFIESTLGGSSDTFLLTGFATEDKRELSERLMQIGHQVVDGFSRQVNFVLALDPDSLSGKAKAARKAGVPVLGRQFVDYLWDRHLSSAD